MTRILKLNRTNMYYKNNFTKKILTGRPIPGYSFDINDEKICDEQIQENISEIINGEGYNYGYYKITVLLKRKYKLLINHKKVYRLCKKMALLKKQRPMKTEQKVIIARNRCINNVNQLWEVDLKYGFIEGEGRFFYILEYIDVYDRNIVDYHVGLRCTKEDAIFTLKNALIKRDISEDSKLIIRSDNGPQFISNYFQNNCKNLGLIHERIPYNTPNKNAHIESFHRILEDDCLSKKSFRNYTEAYLAIIAFIDYYNNIRIHSSIKYLSPTEYHEKLVNNNIRRVVMKL